ncbi:NAD-dependent epimerase/dehydratase family protein [Mycolicibacter senuensis]|uniref:dTDP-glucose 4,6-dehydratase n=1 Tax=Mycolicibacter senuensis TaxID=386913 RepID=A0A7I9XEX8_9MYCO|nr:NAD-dependent epimerase/dehydratase family protein [Mycolicibacter senuensis]ORW64730.1 epimerase [Mycolicibacter senuensis]GFG68519.1 dTDP-glucose 4,6-dehydratase [Mycolicibacter senuensis]
MRALDRVLITGGAGFLGSRLCTLLLAEGAQRVWCVDDLSTASEANLAVVQQLSGVEFVEHDIAEGFPDPRRFGPLDAVLHLASAASPPDYLRLPIPTLRAGAQGTAAALAMAEACGARFVLASTSEVYGDPLVHPQDESYWGNVNPIGLRSVYDEAKRFAEALTFAYQRARGADAGVARIFNSYGPGMRLDDGRMVPTFCGQALRGEPITVAGTGRQTRSLCYVDDTVAGLIALTRHDVSGPVNIGSPDELTVLEVAELIRERSGSASPIRHIAAAEDDPQRRCPDIRRARESLGWAPKVGAAEGLDATIAWFRTQIDATATV